MFKNFILKKLLDSKLKGVPEEQKEKIMELIEKKPELFQMIAAKTQEKMKQGKSQMDAVMEVVKENESELKDALK